jgi:hypothetical protein
MMGLVRTNITLPEETLALIDAVAGPRGRSRYIADVIAKQVRRDNARIVFEKYAGFLKDSDTWGRTPEETDRLLREARESWDRPWIWEEGDALRSGHDAADRPLEGSGGRRRTRRVAVRGVK